MHLTPTTLEAAYEYLRTTPPFNKWRLPHADDVEFQVRRLAHYGDQQDLTGRPRIRISSSMCKHTPALVLTMAHEMVHLHQFANAAKSRLPSDHGPKFRRLALQVCRQHGFDVATF